MPMLALFGFLFSKFAPEDPDGGWLRTSAFRHGWIYTTLFNTSALACYLVAPEWMWMYFVDDGTTPVLGLVYIFAFMYYAPYLAGFFLGVMLRPRVAHIWLWGVLAMFAVNGAIVGALWDRYAVVGTTAEYLEGTAKSLFAATPADAHPVSIIMNVYVVVMLAYLIIYWRNSARSSA